jgi:hypothetical protein
MFEGRKVTHYLLIQEGNEAAFRELKQSLEERESKHNAGQSKFIYIPAPFATPFSDPSLSSVAAWWNPSKEGLGIRAEMNAPSSNVTWRLNLDAFDHRTNALLFIHIRKGE